MRVVGSTDDVDRLVEHVVDEVGCKRQRDAVDFDERGRGVDLLPEVGSDATDGHPALTDHLLGATAGREPGMRDQLLQAFDHSARNVSSNDSTTADGGT